MASVNDRLLDRGIRHAVYLEQLKNREVARMVQFMDTRLLPELESTLRVRLGVIARRGYDHGVMTTKRYQQMLDTLKGQIAGGFRVMGQTAQGRLLRIGASEAEWARATLERAVPLDIAFNSVNLPLLRASLSSRPFQGRLLRDWYARVGDSAMSQVREQLNIGLNLGEPPEKLVRRLMGPASGGKFAGNAPLAGQVRRNVRTLVRTSTNHIAQVAREATYEANADIVKAVRYVATLDARTTDICMSLDGKEFPVGQGPRPPSHHQCRSTTVPITKSWKELGINLRDPRLGRRAMRDVQTGLSGLSPTPLNYGQWLAQQPAAVQNQILGPARADLFRSGRIKFDQFFQDGRRLTLRELQSLEGITVPDLPPDPEVLPEPPVAKPPEGSATALREELLAEHGDEISRLAWQREKLEELYQELLRDRKAITDQARRASADEYRAIVGDFNKKRDVWLKRSAEHDEAAGKFAKVVRDKIAQGGQGNLDLKMAEKGQPYFSSKGQRRSVGFTSKHQAQVDDAQDFLNNLWRREGQADALTLEEAKAALGAMSEAELDAVMMRGGWYDDWARAKAAKASRSADGISTRAQDDVMEYLRGRAAEMLRKESATTGAHDVELVMMRKGNRAHADGRAGKYVRIDTADKTRVYVHELGHTIETRTWSQDALAYRKFRAAVRQPDGSLRLPPQEAINSLGERGWSDQFLDGYFGRVYNHSATEITSMYAEYLYADPAALLARDPHGFDFIVDLFRGVRITEQSWFRALPEADRTWLLRASL